MAKFLFVSYSAAGHITPTLEVASAVRRRGHDVAILTAPVVGPLAAAHDVELIPTRRWKADLDRIPAQRAPASPFQSLLTIRRTMRGVLFADAPLTAEDLTETLASWPADVVVSGDMTPGVSLVMGRLQRPWATVAALITCPFPSRDLPPWGSAIPLPESALGRQKAVLARRVVSWLVGPLAREWSAVRAQYRLPATGRDLAEAFSSPFLYLIPSSVDFDRPRSDLPAQVHYVGPCVAGAPAQSTWENPFPRGRPLVYATAGTVHNSAEFLSKLIAASQGEGYDLFVTVGKNHDESAFRALPANVKVAPFVPQDLVLEKAAAVLCNGGSGAVMGSLVRGRPLVLVPLAADQPENAQRCVERGVGVSLRERSLSVETIRRAVRRVLGEDGFRERARRLGGKLSALNGPGNAADLLEQLAERRAPVLRPD
jgi:MGT family glycosyltransferase